MSPGGHLQLMQPHTMANSTAEIRSRKVKIYPVGLLEALSTSMAAPGFQATLLPRHSYGLEL